MPDYEAPESTGPSGLNGEQVRTLYEELKGQYSARNADYKEAGDLYRGIHWDGTKLVAERDRYSLTANYIRTTVDKGVEGIVGIMPAIQVIPPGVEQEERDLAEQAEAILYGTWQKSRMDNVLRRVMHNVVLKRRGYVYMWWDKSTERVRYRSLPSENVYPLYDGEDMIQVIVVSVRNTDELKRAYSGMAGQITSIAESDDVISDDPGRNGSASGKSATTRVLDWFDRHGNWTRVMGDAVWTENLGYKIGRVPVYEFLNNLPGDEAEPRSDIDDIIELNRYLNQLYSQQADIIKKYANPPIINEDTGQTAIDVQRAVRSDGGVIPVKRGGKLSYLNWDGSMPEISAQIDRTLAMIHDLSGKPPSAYGQTVTNQSGVVTNLALTPSVAQTTARETLAGATLQDINADTLRLYEKFMSGKVINLQGSRKGRTPYQTKYNKVTITGADLGGWTENRIKWPSAYRVDDPVYVQNKIALMQMDPPALSVYDGLEELGYDDVEGRLDRVQAQLEDPRMHPDRMSSAIEAATALGGAQLPTDLAGLAGGGGDPAAAMNEAAESMGSPDRSALVAGA